MADQLKDCLFLVTHTGPQATLLANYLDEHTGLVTRILAPDAILPAMGLSSADGVILIDHAAVTLAQLQKWQEQAVAHEDGTRLILAAFNLESEEQANELLSYVYLQGVFFRHDTLELMAQGILRIRQGELWASRRLTAQVIDNLRRHHLNAYRQTGNLTTRERQILGLLGLGASNHEIAERLFLSEHTVKSHVYNIFKKIGVRNRAQAVGWARDQLGMPLPVLCQSPRNPCAH